MSLDAENLRLDAVSVEASTLQQSHIDNANPGVLLAYKLALRCMRVIRSGRNVQPRIGADDIERAITGAVELPERTDPNPRIFERDITLANELYAQWSKLTKPVRDAASAVWEKAKRAWSTVVGSFNDSMKQTGRNVADWVNETVVQVTADALDMAVRALKEGLGDVRKAYYDAKSEMFDWTTAAVVLLIAWGYARRD